MPPFVNQRTLSSFTLQEGAKIVISDGSPTPRAIRMMNRFASSSASAAAATSPLPAAQPQTHQPLSVRIYTLNGSVALLLSPNPEEQTPFVFGGGSPFFGAASPIAEPVAPMAPGFHPIFDEPAMMPVSDTEADRLMKRITDDTVASLSFDQVAAVVKPQEKKAQKEFAQVRSPACT